MSVIFKVFYYLCKFEHKYISSVLVSKGCRAALYRTGAI